MQTTAARAERLVDDREDGRRRTDAHRDRPSFDDRCAALAQQSPGGVAMFGRKTSMVRPGRVRVSPQPSVRTVFRFRPQVEGSCSFRRRSPSPSRETCRGQGISSRGEPRPRATGIVGQLPRVRGRTPGLPPRGVRPRWGPGVRATPLAPRLRPPRGPFRSTCGTSLRKARLELETRNSRGRTARPPCDSASRLSPAWSGPAAPSSKAERWPPTGATRRSWARGGLTQ